MRSVAGSISVGLLLLVIVPTAMFVSDLPRITRALMQESSNVALIPNNYGAFPHGGSLARSGFPEGFAPAFTDLDLLSIRDDVADPIVAGGYDTLVLVQVDLIQDWLSNPTFKSRIDNFVFNGGKLIIWDSENTYNDYSNFVYPFMANTPGQQGAWSGDLWIVENNDLGTNNTASASYVNTATLHDLYDIGDANVMVALDPNWYTHMVAKNVYGVEGPVQTYARFGHGLIIYNGLDMDYMYDGQVIANDDDGVHNLGYIWYLQLKQQWDPDNLPGEIRTSGITVTPQTSTNPAGTIHTVTATVRDDLANPVQGVPVTFRIFSGPNAGLTDADTTDAAGQAYFSWTSTSTGIDTINATALSPFQLGITIFDDKAIKTWIANAHDLAVTNVQPYKTVVGQGFSSKINVTVANQGAYAETFDVSLYADSGQVMSEVGLVGYWKFDEGNGPTTYDSSGNNNNGAVSGATWTTGKIGNALQFDGTNDYVIVPNSKSLNISSDKISITAWVKVLGDGTRNGVIVCKQAPSGTSDASYSLDVYPSTHYPVGRHVEFALNLGSWNAYVGTSILNANDWYHIAGTYDGSKVRIFINGVLDGEYAMTGNIVPKSGPLYFGHEDAWQPPGEYFNGTVDEVRIYSRALNEGEIKALAGVDLVGYWKFDEGTGITAYDSSGNGNNGTLVNGPTWVSGKYGKALSFDGVNDFVEVPDTEFWNYGYNNFSISMWMKFNSVAGSQSMIGQSNGPFPDTDKWAMHSNFPPGATNNIVFLMRGATGKDITADWAASTSIWYHVAFTRESSTWKFYVNGVNISSEVFSGAVPNSVSTLKIGTDGELWRYFNGTIDEVQIYNRTLSTDEIREEYSRAPVGYWKFDEGNGTTASDSSGNSNHGTLINGPAWLDGKIGKALSFDGINDYVDIAATTSLYNFPQMTIEAWINPKSDGGVVIDRGFYSSPYWTISVGNSMGGMRWNTGQTTNDQGVLQDTTNIPYNAWTHIALALIGIDSASHNATWYINGQKKSSAILPTGLNAITSTSNPLLIGKTSHPMYPGHFNGTIDEIRIYGRALSQNEIKTLADADLVGYWKSDEGSGAMTQDSSGSGNNGTLVDGPTWVNGRCNKALTFDGINDRIEVPSSSSLNITDQITIMGWFSLKSKIVNEGIGAGHSLAEKWNVYGIRIDSSGFHGYVSINGNESAGELGAPIDPSTNTWYHVAYTYDGTQSRIYVNGRLEASKTVTGKIDTSSLPLWIGANDGGGQFNGTIDEVRIYDRALSTNEIWTQYAKTPIATQTVTLQSGTSTTLTFTWNTTGFAKGNYTISAYAWPVSGETGTNDNLFTDGWVSVAMLGDLNADNIVDIFDITTVALAFNSEPSNTNWNPIADINNDYLVDIFDIVVVALHFGEIG